MSNIFKFIFLAGMVSFVTGWGFTNQTAKILPNKLQALEVKIVDWKLCNTKRKKKILEWHICAGLPIKFKSTCQVNNLNNFY